MKLLTSSSILGARISWMALVLFRSTSIPRSFTKKPNSFYVLTPNEYFAGFSFSWYFHSLSNSLLNTCHIIFFFCKYFIHIDLHFSVHYLMKQSDHFSLIWSLDILQSKWHHFIVECSSMCDKYGLLFLFFYYSNLAVAKESIHEWICGILCSFIN